MTRQQVDHLKSRLESSFSAEVDVESVGKGRYRLAVVSPRFNRMSHLKRQDVVWKVVDESLNRNAVMGISLILTFSPRELANV